MISFALHKIRPLGVQAQSVTNGLIFYPHAKITFHDVLNICDGHTDCHLWGCLNMISITPNSIFVFQQVFFALLHQPFHYFIIAFHCTCHFTIDHKVMRGEIYLGHKGWVNEHVLVHPMRCMIAHLLHKYTPQGIFCAEQMR